VYVLWKILLLWSFGVCLAASLMLICSSWSDQSVCDIDRFAEHNSQRSTSVLSASLSCNRVTPVVDASINPTCILMHQPDYVQVLRRLIRRTFLDIHKQRLIIR
jgi:hypothetical protein